MKRIPMKGGVEHDVFTSWRRVYCYTKRAGVCKAVKRKYNKRFRREGKMNAWASI